MKTKILRAVILMFVVCMAQSTRAAEPTVVDFSGVPPTYTPVEDFNLPGISLSSGGRWIADEVCNSCFEHLNGRAISAFPDGAAVLTIDFDAAVSNVRMDFGSSQMGVALTILVNGFYEGRPVFSQTFTTHTVPGGADEVRAQTTGVVDQIVFARTSGAAHLILDNLTFSTVVPEDRDHDGVPDTLDQCSDTPSGAVVNARGCSLEQLVPCSGPRPGRKWRSHGEYVKSVILMANRFWRERLITRSEWSEIIRAAAKSNCGKQKKK
jgi:hypothetical protein